MAFRIVVQNLMCGMRQSAIISMINGSCSSAKIYSSNQTKIHIFKLCKASRSMPQEFGSRGCRVFMWGGMKLERFLPKNQHAQRKLLNI